MRDSKLCYYCGSDAVSFEHVPPKCIFPEIKDIGVNYRKNLITVPSCAEHNMLKSTDDEYLLFIISISYNVNQIGLNHFFSKVVRAVDRSPNRLIQFLSNKRNIYFEKNGNLSKSIEFSVDIERYNKIIQYISRGLFYHEFNRIFSGNTKIIYNGLLHNSDMTKRNKYIKVDNEIRELLKPIPYKGENKSIFQYKFLSGDRNYILRFEFYENFAITIQMIE